MRKGMQSPCPQAGLQALPHAFAVDLVGLLEAGADDLRRVG